MTNQHCTKKKDTKILKKNYYVLDTSSLLFDPASLTHFSGHNVIIPVSVLQELDKHKDRLDEVGSNARTVNRKLYELKKFGNLYDGVEEPDSKVFIKIAQEVITDVPHSLDASENDNKILSVCLTLSKIKNRKNRIYLVTNDLNLGLKSEAYEIKSLEFKPEEKYKKTEYCGYREVEEADDLIINDLYTSKQIICPIRLDAIENEYFIIKNKISNKSALAIYKRGNLNLFETPHCYSNIKPLNVEQKFAMDLLLNPDIKLVTLTGCAGTGKTILSIAAGLYQCIEPRNKKYEKLMLSRSLTVLSGKDRIGFLKGDLKNKLEPFLLGYKDAIDQVIGQDSQGFEYLTASMDNNKKGFTPKIEIEPLSYIRGRSLRDSYFIIDEGQNTTISELKTIISRAAEGCKIVILGDIMQIDSPYLSKYTNGLSQVVERFKGSNIAGHITLKEGVRSQLSAEAAERL